MVNRDIILRRMEKIDVHVSKLRTYQKVDYNRFLEDTDIQDIVEYNLFQTVNHLIDIVEHIVVDEGYGLPESAYEGVEILLKKRAIEEATAGLLKEMIGFRNRVAHEYIHIDKKVVHDIVTCKLDDIIRIASVLVEGYL